MFYFLEAELFWKILELAFKEKIDARELFIDSAEQLSEIS